MPGDRNNTGAELELTRGHRKRRINHESGMGWQCIKSVSAFSNVHQVSFAKMQLQKVISSKIPSLFSSFYGLGTHSFLFFEYIDFVRLYDLDLRLLRDITSQEYRLFAMHS